MGNYTKNSPTCFIIESSRYSSESVSSSISKGKR
jgi:hypothetical protein